MGYSVAIAIIGIQSNLWRNQLLFGALILNAT